MVQLAVGCHGKQRVQSRDKRGAAVAGIWREPSSGKAAKRVVRAFEVVKPGCAFGERYKRGCCGRAGRVTRCVQRKHPRRSLRALDGAGRCSKVCLARVRSHVLVEERGVVFAVAAPKDVQQRDGGCCVAVSFAVHFGGDRRCRRCGYRGGR